MSNNNEAFEHTRRIAERLEEKERKPLSQIRAVVEKCGPEFADIMADAAIEIHSTVGLKTLDGTRDRTLGGVFFYLVRGALPTDLRRAIFPYRQELRIMNSKYPPLEWDKRAEQLQHLIEADHVGEVKKVNIILKGRPTEIERRAGVVVMTLEQRADPEHTYPRGMPEIPEENTRFYVFVGEGQFNKQKGGTLQKNKTAEVTVEGACAFDRQLQGIAVFARSFKVSIPNPAKKKDKGAKEAVAEGGENGKGSKPAAAAPAEAVEAAPPKEEEPRPEDKLADYPEAIAKKLRPLYGARRMFQKRLADIEAMPEDKQSGLQAARMMLERTEKQIAELEAQAEGK